MSFRDNNVDQTSRPEEEMHLERLCRELKWRASKRWSRFVRQLAKVDLPMRRMIHYEDAETVFV
jgi:hypothetical protein